MSACFHKSRWSDLTATPDREIKSIASWNNLHFAKLVEASEDHTDTLLEPIRKADVMVDEQEIERRYLENLTTPKSSSNVNRSTTSKIFLSKATQTGIQSQGKRSFSRSRNPRWLVFR